MHYWLCLLMSLPSRQAQNRSMDKDAVQQAIQLAQKTALPTFMRAESLKSVVFRIFSMPAMWGLVHLAVRSPRVNVFLYGPLESVCLPRHRPCLCECTTRHCATIYDLLHDFYMLDEVRFHRRYLQVLCKHLGIFCAFITLTYVCCLFTLVHRMSVL